MNSPHILIVDDDTDVLAVTNLVLKQAQLKVSNAESAESCLEMLTAENDFDLVLLDIMMPGMSGLELLEQLRAENATKELPILLHSSMGEDDVIVTGLELGADDFISKTTSSQVKLSRINAALRRSTHIHHGDEAKSSHTKDVELIDGELKLRIKDSIIEIDAIEKSMLELFTRYAGSLLSISDFMTHARETHPQITRKIIESTMSNFVKRIGPHGKRFEKVLGIGYRLRVLP